MATATHNRRPADKPVVPLDCDKIKRLREAAGLSMTEAAKLASVGSRQSWHQIEAGLRTNITLDVLEKIAAALGVSARDLLKD